jgi:hypothetical protein
MLYKRLGQKANLCVLRVSPEVLELEGVVVSDQNSSSTHARFAPGAEGLGIVDATLTFAHDWTHPDPIEYWRRKAAKCAEVLVPNRIPPQYLLGARVCSEHVAHAFNDLECGLEVTVDTKMFFM